jgi:phosphate:Na+ symporter
MGQNIGTCVTALISSIGTTTKARRVAFLHIALNSICSIFCLIVMMLAQAFVPAVANLLGQAVQPWDIALLHTLFNIVATVVLMPFAKQLVWLVEHVIRERGGAQPVSDVPMLDERLLRSPSVAVGESFHVSKEMCREAHEILQEAIALVEDYNPSMEENILWMEDRLDRYEDKLGTYLVKLSSESLSSEDSQVVSKILHAIGDFERLGDHACNMVDVAKEMHEKKITFSPNAAREIKVLTDAIQEILNITACAYDGDSAELAAKVEPLEQVIDGLISKIRANHIRRLQKGACTIEGGFILADLLNNYERVSDHCSNIAVAIIEVEHNSFDTHKYLNGVKYGNSVFNEIYETYQEKYAL